MDQRSPTEAVFLYYGILEAYEDVGKELIGDDIIEKHVINKMSYYLKQFIPDFKLPDSQGEIEENLLKFLNKTREKIKSASRNPNNVQFTNENVWELRAAIFGFESVFIEILGEHVIKDYVFSRIAEILSVYLPNSFGKSADNLDEKLLEYVKYLEKHKLIKHGDFGLKEINGKPIVSIRANKCIFAQIHDSEAYLNSKVRFCPWGMIGSAIVTNHVGKSTTIKSCQFVTRGTVSKIVLQED